MLGPHLRELRHELHALRLAARQRRALLAEREVAEPHVAQQLERVVDLRVRREEPDRLVDRHREHVADALAAKLDRERLAVEALAAAALAVHAHVGQEAHLDLLQALPFAALAAAARDVEREPARVVAAEPRLGRVGEELADLVPDADVGCRARARRLADRRLIHLEHAADALPARRGSCRFASAGGLAAARGDEPREVVVQHVADERALAAAADARHADEPLQRQRDVELLQVVARDARRAEPLASSRFLGLRARALLAGADTARRGCSGCRGGDASTRPVIERSLASKSASVPFTIDLAAVAPGAGAEIDDVLGAADRLLVVLDDDDRVALRREPRDRVEQQIVVARMQADRRLVEDVADAAQVRAELRREPDALRLAARQRRRRAVEREVAQPDEIEEAEPALELGQHVARDLALALLELQPRSARAPRRTESAADGARCFRRGTAPRAPRASDAGRRTPGTRAGSASASAHQASSPVCSTSKPASSHAGAVALGHQP